MYGQVAIKEVLEADLDIDLPAVVPATAERAEKQVFSQLEVSSVLMMRITQSHVLFGYHLGRWYINLETWEDDQQ